MHGPSDHDRRRHRRFTLMKPAILHLGTEAGPVDGKLMDLSESGAAFAAPRSVPVHSGVFLRFRIEPDISCEATGTVVRCFHFGNDWGIAVDLTYANKPFLNFLRNLEAVHEAERPSLLGDITDLQAHFG